MVSEVNVYREKYVHNYKCVSYLCLIFSEEAWGLNEFWRLVRVLEHSEVVNVFNIPETQTVPTLYNLFRHLKATKCSAMAPSVTCDHFTDLNMTFMAKLNPSENKTVSNLWYLVIYQMFTIQL